MNGGQRWIRKILLALFGMRFGFFRCGCFRCYEHFKLVGGFVQTQFESVAACFPLPATKRDELCTAHEFRGVVLDDVVSTTTRHEPPDNYFAATHWAINSRDL